MSHNGDYSLMCHILKESYFKCMYILNQMEMHTIVEFGEYPWNRNALKGCGPTGYKSQNSTRII